MKQQKGGGAKKIGRMAKKPTHARYNAEERWIRNKAKRIVKQIRKFPGYKPFNLSGDVQLWVTKLMRKKG